jgi:phage baseplate assembly protein W
MTHVAYPFHFDTRGRAADAPDEAYVRELIDQVLFTAPGERVNRPTFGCGVMQLVFAPNSPELAAASQFLIQGALQEWLGTIIIVESVTVDAVDSMLTVRIAYVLRRTQVRQSAEFTVPGAGA